MQRSFLLLLLLAACGGKIADDGDGGLDGSVKDSAPVPDAKRDVTILPDADDLPLPPPKPDASPIACSSKTGQGYVGSNGECGEIDEWKCSDGNVYELSCKCPPDPNGQTCACRKNGITTKIFAGNVCPNCAGVVKFASQCGFPE